VEIFYLPQEDASAEAVVRKSEIFLGLDGSCQLDMTSSEDVHQPAVLKEWAKVVSHVHVGDHDQVCEHELVLGIFGAM
jgi:hypothetical protein